ncbi:sigma-70 family RNA polymerase sigma factor [Cognatilysobacter lacus]|uniref:Sigma-70 family RNA polymerase sigma factor n=1 Tax=Cognatilysobacter lacus TaxID=1643323 RepID=A0A5D8Z5A3_9GAMM|nr:sigma-70 family RNA polymerase sigma factor [Lysobacter lacus]TZF89830.1 sigma-70 family RNA polymerase sigma factor [Lysobacter lacus]
MPGDITADPQAALLLHVAQGDRQAFERLYRLASPRLFAICIRVLSDRAEAEDVLQDVFATIWHKAEQFDPDRAGAMAWMAMIARNRAIDRLRAPGHAARTTAIELGDELPDAGLSPVDEAEASDDRERLQRCLDKLDDRRRGLIRTAFFEGATYEELASRSGAPLGSVKSWIRRGLLQLRTCLEP